MIKKVLTKIFIDEIYSPPPKNNYPTKESKIKSIDDIWFSDLLDMNDKNITNARFVQVNQLPQIDSHLTAKQYVDNAIDESSLV